MITRLTILFVMIFCAHAYAQEQNGRALPSAKQIPRVSTIIATQSDSIPSTKIQSDSLEALKENAKIKIDRWRKSATDKSDSVKGKVTLPAVKMPELKSPPTTIASPTDSLASDKVDLMKEKVESKVDAHRETLMENVKVGSLDGDVSELGIDSRIPELDGVTKPNASLPQVNSIDIPGIDATIQRPAAADVKTPDVAAPESKVPSIPDVGTKGVDKVTPDLGEVESKISGATDKVDALQKQGDAQLQQVESIQKEVRDVQQSGVDGTAQVAEEKIENVDAVKNVKKKVAPATQKQAEMEAMIKKYQDKQQAKAELERKLGNVVNEQINQFTPSVQNNMGEMEKVKKRWNGARQLGDSVQHKKLNLMSGKPFGRRLIPGVTIQVLKGNVYTADLGAQVGYRFTQNITVGIGGAHRFGINKQFDHYVQSLRFTSVRLYGDLMLKKGWFPHGELEFVKTPGSLVTEQQPESNVIQTNIGIGKSYKLSKRLKGYALVLYRIEWHGELEDQSKLSLRVGFNFDTRKRKTKVINNVKIKL